MSDLCPRQLELRVVRFRLGAVVRQGPRPCALAPDPGYQHLPPPRTVEMLQGFSRTLCGRRFQHKSALTLPTLGILNDKLIFSCSILHFLSCFSKLEQTNLFYKRVFTWSTESCFLINYCVEIVSQREKRLQSTLYSHTYTEI